MSNKTKHVMIRMTPKLHRQALREAKRLEISLAEFIRHAIAYTIPPSKK